MDVEKYIIGAILIEKNAINDVVDIINHNDFFNFNNLEIYKIIEEFYKNNIPIDLVSVAQKYNKISYLNECTHIVGSSSNIRHYAFILKEKSIKRDLKQLCMNTIDSIDSNDIFDTIDKMDYGLQKLNTFNIVNVKTANDVFKKIKQNILLGKATGKIFRSNLGLEFLSKTFNVIAGFQGTGKTAMLLTLANEFALNYKIGVFSMEMANEMLSARLIQQETSIFAKKIITNELTSNEKEIIFDIKSLSENILIDDGTNITNNNIIGKIKSLKNRFDIDIVFIDYIQLIDIDGGKNDTDVKKMERLTKLLQNVSKDLDICIIVLAQLTRGNDRPTAQQLRGGGIEQSASSIYILYDENWKQNDGKKWEEIQELRGHIEVIDAKNRYDGVNNRCLYFNKPKQVFEKWNEFFEKNNSDIF